MQKSVSTRWGHVPQARVSKTTREEGYILPRNTSQSSRSPLPIYLQEGTREHNKRIQWKPKNLYPHLFIQRTWLPYHKTCSLILRGSSYWGHGLPQIAIPKYQGQLFHFLSIRLNSRTWDWKSASQLYTPNPLRDILSGNVGTNSSPMIPKIVMSTKRPITCHCT